MDNISNYLIEKLTITPKSVIRKTRGILDQKIEKLEDLIPLCQAYFEQFYKIKISNISTLEQKWRFYKTKFGLTIKKHFEIKFYNNLKCNQKLRFGNFGDNILMQTIVLNNKGRWENCRIHGGSPINEFKIGDNFLDFILRIKKHTDENHMIGKDNNLMKLFKDL